jgi:DNA-binding MarR family transcriptional regulator
MIRENNKINHIPTENPGRDAFHALIRVSGLLDTIMQLYFGRFGISRSQWSVLRNLYRAEEEGLSGLRPADLGNRMLVRPPSVTGLVDRMERLGYVQRIGHTQDLRSKEVRLTASGRSLVDRILPGHPAQIALVMGGLDARRQKQLYRLLQRVEVHLEAVAEGTGEPAARHMEAGSMATK